MLHEKLLVSASTPTPPADGYLFTSGSNANFRTAQGLSTGFTTSFTPTGSYVWLQIEAPDAGFVGLRNDGTIWSVGDNSSGATGQGTTSGNTTALTQIGSDNTWVYISCKANVSFGIKSNGTLWAWGINQYYSTGLGTDVGNTTTPTQVGTDTDWAVVAAGSRHGAAIKNNGTLWTWGSNGQGMTAQNTTSGDTTTPTQSGTDTDWESIACGEFATHAIKTGGTLWAAGYGPYIGFGPTVTAYVVMTQIGSDTNWFKVTNGNQRVIALKTNGTIYSCGSNTSGTTGLGTGSGFTDFLTQIGSATDWDDVSVNATGTNAQTIALKGGGQLWGWGANASYQLGLGSLNNTNQLSPVQIGSNTDWIQMVAGNLCSASIRDSLPPPVVGGNIITWGFNASYCTGQGTNVGNTQVPTLTPTGSTNWVTVMCMIQVTVALKNDGTLWTVGRNTEGITGQGTTTGVVSTWTQIGTDTDWAKLHGKGTMVFAIKTNGTLWAWGANANYRTGLNTSTGFTTTPTQVGTDTDWANVFGGSQNSAAIKNNGTLWTWGSNASGATGQGTTSGFTQVPTQVGSSTDWASAACFNLTMLVIKTNGTLWGCGDGTNYVIGSNGSSYSVPTQIGSDTNWVKASSCNMASILLKTNGTLWSCGVNTNGTTGQGTFSGNTPVPTQIGSGTNWSDCSTNGSFPQAFGLKAGGQLWGWGSNTEFQVGNGTNVDVSAPVRIGDDSDWGLITAGANYSAALKATAPSRRMGGLYVLGGVDVFTNSGAGTYYSSVTQLGSDLNWVAFGAEQAAAYFIKSDGTLWYTGAPGGGVLTSVGSLTQAGTDTDWIAIACSFNSSVGLKNNGTIWSWGSNSTGSPGQGTTAGNTSFATQIGSDTTWTSISSSFFTIYALKNNGTLWSWGSNTNYATGLNTNSGTTTSPTQVGSATDWGRLQSGSSYYCGFAIKTTGTLWGWGSNGSYQQGNGSTGDITVPTQIGSAADWISVGNSGAAANQCATVGVRSTSGTNRTLWSWGSNTNGITGQNTTSGNTTTPTQVGSDVNWSMVRGGNLYTFNAIKTTGALYGWGSNASGTTGQATTSGNTIVPTQIGALTTWFLMGSGVYAALFLRT